MRSLLVFHSKEISSSSSRDQLIMIHLLKDKLKWWNKEVIDWSYLKTGNTYQNFEEVEASSDVDPCCDI